MRARWQRAGDILQSVLRRAGIEEGFRRQSALLHWDEVVGRKIALRARPRELEGKTLVVDVDGSAWIHELSYLKDDILRELNRRVGGNAIDRIVFFAAESVDRQIEQGR